MTDLHFKTLFLMIHTQKCLKKVTNNFIILKCGVHSTAQVFDKSCHLPEAVPQLIGTPDSAEKTHMQCFTLNTITSLYCESVKKA